ncbi:hypothetical protein IGI04_021853 [Brassica rapa subsp. trilocularis]|uniref:Uncharacterized protein n=1 Tax=Brassica rapa subsp. trilocularis TaxID=1813537 RepID=A0ABQ7LZ96_BRACM|nr:hypothetical protein IGI04_021853 [Brassica rapa subsp. trilocularis]
MTSRHTRSNAQGPLHQLTNEELARLERQNRQLPRPTSTNMGDHQDDLTAAFALMQQQMQQMQQTIQANAANQRNAPEEVDQLIKSNQNHVFIMEESPQDKGTIDATSEADQATEDHHEVSYVNGQGWQFKNYHPNPNVRNNPHLFNNPKPDGNTENAQGNQKESEQPPVTAPADEEEAELPVKHTPTTTEQPTVVVRPVAEPVPTRDYVPKVLYPVPAKATRKDKEEMKCRKMLEDLTVRLPLMSAIQMMPSMKQNVQNIDADGYAKMLDSARTMERLHSLEAASEVRMSRRRKEQGAQAKNQRALQLEKRDFRGTGEQPATPAAAIQTESGVGRRMKRACLKRSCPFGAFCGEHSRRTVPRLFSSRTSRQSDPELDDGIDQQRDHHHDSGVFQLSDPSSRKHCTALE